MCVCVEGGAYKLGITNFTAHTPAMFCLFHPNLEVSNCFLLPQNPWQLYLCSYCPICGAGVDPVFAES